MSVVACGKADLRPGLLAFLLGSTVLATAPVPAGAAEAPVVVAQAAEQRLAFDIGPQPLDSALIAFSEASRVQVLVNGDLTRGVASPGARGRVSPQQALAALLTGTGLSFRQVDANTITLIQAPPGQRTGGGAAPAQAPAPVPAPAATAVIQLDPLEVYGARTTQTLGDLTSSVGILTQGDIEARQMRSIRGAFRMFANVGDSDFTDAGFIIRGINSEGLTPGGAPLASFYVDGIQQTVQGTRRGARGLWDARQMEVYRGPQSTLAGRAALAGAIYVKTNDPTYQYEAAAEGLFGNLETRGGALMFNAPVVENEVAVRLAAEYQRSENDINYPTYRRFEGYKDFIEDEYFSLRGKVLLEPGALTGTRALLTYSYSEDSPVPRDIAGPGLGFSFGDDRGDFNTPNFAEDRRSHVHNAGLDITHEFAPGLTLTAQTGFSRSDTDRPSINVGTAGETDVVIGDFIQRLATQEFRLNFSGERLDATAGLYGAYDDDKSGFRRPDFFGFASDISRSTQETHNIAAFGEVAFEFVPSWKIVLGGRLDHTEQKGSSFFSRNGVATTDFRYSFTETTVLPKAGLVKEFGEDHTAGLTVQRGFRTGGAGVQRSTGQVFTFDPEYVWNYEASYKGRFLENRLNLAANVFYADFTDQQVETLATPGDLTSARTVNAASARSFGFEIEAQAQVSSELSGFLSIGFVDTKFEDFNSSSLGNLSGLPFPEAPEWSVAFGALYEHRSGFFIGADAKYTDDFLARIGTAPQEMLSGYFIANLQLGYRYENLTATVFAENLFDERYFVFNDNDIAATLGLSRFVGVKLNVRL